MENSDFYKSPLCNALYTISLVILNFDWNAFMRQSSLMGSEFSTFHLETYKSLVGPFKHFNRKHLASVRSFPMRVCQNVWQSDHLLLFQPIKKQLCWSIILWLVEVVVGAQKFICQLKNAIKLFSTVMPEGEKIWGRGGESSSSRWG